MSRLPSDFNPYEAVPQLCAPWPAYVSLYSALSDHGLVAEVPRLAYAVSAGRPARLSTPIGAFRIHHLPARLMWGYEMSASGSGAYPMADPEKAFLDTVYLALIPRSRIRLPHKRASRWRLDGRKLKAYARRFSFEPLTRWLVGQRLLSKR
jgi:hypothetical protein